MGVEVMGLTPIVNACQLPGALADAVAAQRLAQHARVTVAADGAPDEAEVERVARALVAASERKMRRFDPHPDVVRAIGDREWRYLISEAEAAIAAIRER